MCELWHWFYHHWYVHLNFRLQTKWVRMSLINDFLLNWEVNNLFYAINKTPYRLRLISSVNVTNLDEWNCRNIFFNFYLFLSIADMPTQLPPLTPGTSKKCTEVLKASFASWEKEVQNCNTTKGNLILTNNKNKFK